MSTSKPPRAHDDELVPTPRPKLPEKSWPGAPQQAPVWEDYDFSLWPFPKEQFVEPKGLAKIHSPTWNIQRDSNVVYPGPIFPAPRTGFTGEHKRDYYQSIEDHATDEKGMKGSDLLRREGFADRNWMKRCYEINLWNHERNIWTRFRDILDEYPPRRQKEDPAPLKEDYAGIALHSEHKPEDMREASKRK